MAWRVLHLMLAVVIVVGTVVHAVLIDGTMEWFSKVALSALVLLATARLLLDLRFPAELRRVAGWGRAGPVSDDERRSGR